MTLEDLEAIGYTVEDHFRAADMVALWQKQELPRGLRELRAARDLLIRIIAYNAWFYGSDNVDEILDELERVARHEIGTQAFRRLFNDNDDLCACNCCAALNTVMNKIHDIEARAVANRQFLCYA